MNLLLQHTVLCVSLVVFSHASLAASLDEMVRMADQLDELDRSEIDAFLRRAEACTKRREFNCSEAEIAKAAKLATSGRDRVAIASARSRVAKERERMEEEAELKRLAEVQAEQEREALIAQTQRDERCESYCSTRQGLSACYAEQFNPEYCSTYEARGAGGPNYGAAIAQGFNQTLQGHARITAIHNQAMANLQSAYEDRARQRRAEQDRLKSQQAQADQERRSALQSSRSSQNQAKQSDGLIASSIGENTSRNGRAPIQRDHFAELQKNDGRGVRDSSKAGEREREAKAKAQHLDQLYSGIRLMARQCFGGQYIVGSRPRITPEVISCIDVHYRAQCTTAGNVQSVEGVGRNFVGMGTDCYSGDTYPIEPKLSCDVNDIQVTLKAVRQCNE